MTKISELKSGQGSVNIEATVKSVEEPRTINKYGKNLRLTNAVITDGESEIKLTLWNEDVDKVKVGGIIKITNGYVSEFQGEKQITSGKFGKLEVIDGKSSEKEKSQKETKKSEEEDLEEEKEVSEESFDDY